MLRSRILRALEDKLARPLTHIFNNSVETIIIPEDWKSANVTAIHKKNEAGKNLENIDPLVLLLLSARPWRD